MSIDLMPGFGAFTQSSAAPWTPANLVYPGVWYDAKDSATITNNGGGYVRFWDDKSGNGRTMIGNILNTSFTWDGVDKITSDAAATMSLGSNLAPNAILRDGVKGILASILTWTSGVIWMKWENADGGSGGRLGFEGNNRVDWPTDNTSTGSLQSWSATLSSSTFKVLSIRHSGSALTARLNGTQVKTLTNSTQFTNPGSAGGMELFGGPGASYSVCSIKTFLICGDNDLTSEEKLEGYLAWRFGLEGDLDAGHPYKSAAPTL
jgi:hypothetical protein